MISNKKYASTNLIAKILACPLSAAWIVPSGATVTAEREPKASCVERTLPLGPQSFSSSVQLKKPAQLQSSEEMHFDFQIVHDRLRD